VEVALAIGLIEDLGLNRALVDVRACIVDARLKGLHVLMRLSLVLLVLEHVADFLEMVWRLESKEACLTFSV
jgi:hypothetical protein